LSTHTRALHGLADWLSCQQVELVAMEPTSDYCKPVYHLLEAQGFTLLATQRHARGSAAAKVTAGLAWSLPVCASVVTACGGRGRG
jgi:hypothetical protein